MYNFDDKCTKQYNISAAKEIKRNTGSPTTYLYCLDYKETDELTEPGYLCDGFGEWTTCANAGKTYTYITRVYKDQYCCNQKYIPLPTKSPIPPRTPWRTPHRTEIKTPDPSVIPMSKNNKINTGNLVSFFVLTTLAP